MPLNKFYSGDYTSPLEEAFGAKTLRMGSPKGESTSEKAIEIVKDLQKGLKDVFNLDTIWEDKGDPKGEQFDYFAFDALRAYAAHLDHPKTKGFFRKIPLDFDPSEDLTKHPGVKRVLRGAATRFPHLIQHANNQGFWFPIDFEQPINLNSDTGLYAGSSVRLKDELNQLKELLNLTKSWADLEEGESISEESDTLGTVKYACALMLHYANLSCDRKLPIVFDG